LKANLFPLEIVFHHFFLSFLLVTSKLHFEIEAERMLADTPGKEDHRN
jgi:hypothetical protein